MDDFRVGRTRQPDDEFLSDCGVAPGTEATRIALAVRRAVAGIGLVDPLFVRAANSYPGTLELLPLWDSMDWLALGLEMERELGHPVRWESGEIMPPLGLLIVSDLVARVRYFLEQVQSTERGVAPDHDGG
ncbi:MAG: hypothetical protein HZA46_08200 [Planctomycetales bacterium]|nr:hypothetical protein [Planctomycetales bacterium]